MAEWDAIRKPRNDDDRVYPCMDCGVLRSKNEGGTTFTVCDECWAERHKGVGESVGEGQEKP